MMHLHNQSEHQASSQLLLITSMLYQAIHRNMSYLSCNPETLFDTDRMHCFLTCFLALCIQNFRKRVTQSVLSLIPMPCYSAFMNVSITYKLLYSVYLLAYLLTYLNANLSISRLIIFHGDQNAVAKILTNQHYELNKGTYDLLHKYNYCITQHK